jgi:hypothetical protein
MYMYVYIYEHISTHIDIFIVCTAHKILKEQELHVALVAIVARVRQHTSASIRQHTSAYVSIRQQAYVSIRQHTSTAAPRALKAENTSSLRPHTLVA